MAINKLKSDYNVCVGVITSVNGVKGYVKIRNFTENPEDLINFKKIFDESNREYQITIIALKKDYLIAGINGVNSRNDAEKLRNIKLFIKRSELPKAASNEYYHADLIGLDVRLLDNTKSGLVKNVVNFGAGDILEIYDINTEKTIYYPFNKQFVPEINLNEGYIKVAPLEEVLATPDNKE